MKIKDKIFKLRCDGKSYNEIAKTLEISKGTISYHCKILNINTPIDGRKVLDQSDVILMNEFYINNSVDETAKKFKISKSCVVKNCKNKHVKLSIEEKKKRNYNKVKKREKI